MRTSMLTILAIFGLNACTPDMVPVDTLTGDPDVIVDTADDDDTADTGDTGDTADDDDSADTAEDPAMAEDKDGDGWTVGEGDCNDSPYDLDPQDGRIDGWWIHPGMIETCNGIDDNCNGQIDEDLELVDVWLDQDGDGYGAGESVEACEGAPGYASVGGDCNDLNDGFYPGAEDEAGDGYDTDCDDETNITDTDTGEEEEVEEEVEETDTGDDDDSSDSADTGDDDDSASEEELPVDADSDGFTDSADCNDEDDGINPDASEICGDGIDQDCDGSDLACEDEAEESDDADDSADTGESTDPDDVDDDGDGQTENEGDCDDTDASVSQLADEVCGDGIDNDCSGDADGSDAVDATEWFVDDDSDGYGDSSLGLSCDAPTGSVSEDGDCDDTDADVSPGADEYPAGINGIDDNCDGDVDEDWQASVEITYGSSVSGTLNTALYSDGASPNVNSWSDESTSVSGTSASVEYLTETYGDISGECGLIINGDGSDLDYLCYGGAQDTDFSVEIWFAGDSYNESNLTVWIANAGNGECALILQVDDSSDCTPVNDE